MKFPFIAATLLLIAPAIAAAQTPGRDRATDNPQSTQSEANAGRDRVVGPKVSNHVDAEKRAERKGDEATPNPAWGNTAFTTLPSTVNSSSSPKPVNSTAETVGRQPVGKLVQPTLMVTAPLQTETVISRAVSAAGMPATSIYRVGINDVLDVRVANVPTKESTLFTVMANGTLEYPLLSAPVSVAGLSTDEIARLLSAEIKVIKAPTITVTVRDYASHAIVIGGLVDSPGRKILRREAMPLFAALAEALVRPEATTATILRNGNEGAALSLKDDQAMATLVMPGDILKITSAPPAAAKFVYIGGDVASPGEKAFREGITLTQVLLSAGGTSAAGKTIKIARRNAAGYLSTSEFNLRSIEQGKTPDPLLEAGDRIEVIRGL
jgi:protein involved in polysaccharide export with SLBB domain